MPRRDALLRLEDMVAHAEVCVELAACSPHPADASIQTRLAMERCIEIIGEAARHVPSETRRKMPSVPWEEIVGMRNVLAHGYFRIEPEVLWTTARDDLPKLITAIRAYQSSLPDA